MSSGETYQVGERLIICQAKSGTITMGRMQLIRQIYKIILNTRIWGWTKQYNLRLDVLSEQTSTKESIKGSDNTVFAS